ncbi:hypothetical protein GGP41_007761 [Bipolaris sorokiniana]|uniref:Uncharacterized protein n=1 Tax=Cochliobolus sativus TaxID=45130 RepID=A0A8H5ZR75_COCSA|nr:hypothetical protein GGP41_007761 [Bipolaris sorokiniana]
MKLYIHTWNANSETYHHIAIIDPASHYDRIAKTVADLRGLNYELDGTFTAQNFVSWNTAVGDDCSGLWADTYYCIGVPGTPTTHPATSTTKPTTTGNGVSTPLPTQPVMITNCNKSHYTTKGVSCS